jgi:hypothetical protein
MLGASSDPSRARGMTSVAVLGKEGELSTGWAAALSCSAFFKAS